MSNEKMCGAEGAGAAASATQSAVPTGCDELFTSDEFRIYCMKVLPCSKRYSHDWPSCPFSHPGEKAKRRDPRTHQYDCEMCPAVLKGETCELGAACPHSHHVFESWLHPQKYRTLLCKDGDQCHREVCFFAHGTKQLRTPERSSHQQQCYGPAPASRTADQQQQHQQHAGSGIKAQQNDSRQAGLQQLPGPNVVICQGYSHPQQLPSGINGAVFAGGSSSSSNSSSTNVTSSASAQFHRLGFVNVPSPAVPQLHQQLGRGLGVSAGGSCSSAFQAESGDSLGSSCYAADLSLVQSLVAQVTASKQEVAESSRAAAASQQKLFLLQQLLGCDLGAANPAPSLESGTPVPQIPVTPVTSPNLGALPPPGGNWQSRAALPQQLRRAPWQQHLQQQLLAGGGLDGAFPRRHSLDESLLYRVRNMQFGAGSSGLGRPRGTGTPGASPVLPTMVECGPDTVASGPSQASASTDLQVLAAALAAAGFRQDTAAPGAHLGRGLASAGLTGDSMLLSPAATGFGQLPSGCNWQGLSVQASGSAGQAWPQLGLACGVRPPMGAFNGPAPMPSGQHSSSQANVFNSAPQLQSDYLLQLQALLQGSGPAVASSGTSSTLGPVRASFDTAAAYLPPLAGEVLGNSVDVVGSDDMAGGSGNSLARLSNNCTYNNGGSSMAATSEQLLRNPVGGANQLGWF